MGNRIADIDKMKSIVDGENKTAVVSDKVVYEELRRQ
jgi:hypothetical protein